MTSGRPARITPARKLNTSLDASLLDEIDKLLFDPTQGRVPHAAYQKFLSTVLRQALGNVALDLSTCTEALPGEYIVLGKPDAIAFLQQALNQGSQHE
jgi:hypothetical protein